MPSKPYKKTFMANGKKNINFTKRIGKSLLMYHSMPGSCRDWLQSLELFNDNSQGSFTKKFKKKYSSHKIYEKKIVWEFWLCIRNGSTYCHYFGKLKQPIGNRIQIWVKESGRTGFSSGWQGCSLGFHLGFALGKSLGAALPALGKPHSSPLSYLD